MTRTPTTGARMISKDALTISQKIAVFSSCGNEVAMGYNDSGCFWHFRWGNRGTGNMIEGIGRSYSSDSGDFEGALDDVLLYIFDSPIAIAARLMTVEKDEIDV